MKNESTKPTTINIAINLLGELPEKINNEICPCSRESHLSIITIWFSI